MASDERSTSKLLLPPSVPSFCSGEGDETHQDIREENESRRRKDPIVPCIRPVRDVEGSSLNEQSEGRRNDSGQLRLLLPCSSFALFSEEKMRTYPFDIPPYS